MRRLDRRLAALTLAAGIALIGSATPVAAGGHLRILLGIPISCSDGINVHASWGADPAQTNIDITLTDETVGLSYVKGDGIASGDTSYDFKFIGQTPLPAGQYDRWSATIYVYDGSTGHNLRSGKTHQKVACTIT
jgi:hypothetical protein